MGQRKELKFTVLKETYLLDFLYQTLDFSKKKTKSLLTHGNISVDGVVTTQYNTLLHRNSIVEIHEGKMVNVKKGEVLPILYEDHEFIVINKPAHLLAVATSKEKEKTAYALVKEHASPSHEKVFTLHRLDQETSGVLVFVKNELLKEKLQNSWNDIVTTREYIALVEGCMKGKRGTLKHYLQENKMGKVFVSKTGKLAITKYQVLKTFKNTTLLKINLETGRKNQIRVQLSHIGYPIVGDKKYGSKMNTLKRLGLHASKIEFIHPITGKKYCFQAPIPRELEIR